MNEYKRTNRIEVIDVVKGISIISVIIGHAMNGSEMTGGYADYIRRFVYFYHLMTFVFVSGYFLRIKDPGSQVIKRKAKSLYIPFVIWSVISCILNYLCGLSGLLSATYGNIIYVAKSVLKSVLFLNI